jgi:DNA cross-link repair 1A protein
MHLPHVALCLLCVCAAGVKPSCVVAVPMNTPTVIQEVEVTLLDANHCPGAAMWLFRLRNGKVFLHVGKSW